MTCGRSMTSTITGCAVTMTIRKTSVVIGWRWRRLSGFVMAELLGSPMMRDGKSSERVAVMMTKPLRVMITVVMFAAVSRHAAAWSDDQTIGVFTDADIEWDR